MSVQSNLMQRMTDALSRMLNDPTTRLAMQRLQNSRGEIERASRDDNREEEQDHEQAAEESESVPTESAPEGAAGSSPNEARHSDDPESSGETREEVDQLDRDALPQTASQDVEARNDEQEEEAGEFSERDAENIGEIRDSISSMRENYVGRYVET